MKFSEKEIQPVILSQRMHTTKITILYMNSNKHNCANNCLQHLKMNLIAFILSKPHQNVSKCIVIIRSLDG